MTHLNFKSAGMPVIKNNGYGEFLVFVPVDEESCLRAMSRFSSLDGETYQTYGKWRVFDHYPEMSHIVLDAWRASDGVTEFCSLGSHCSEFQGWGVVVPVYPTADKLDHTLEATEIGLDEILAVASLVKQLIN